MQHPRAAAPLPSGAMLRPPAAAAWWEVSEPWRFVYGSKTGGRQACAMTRASPPAGPERATTDPSRSKRFLSDQKTLTINAPGIEGLADAGRPRLVRCPAFVLPTA